MIFVVEPGEGGEGGEGDMVRSQDKQIQMDPIK